MKRLLLDPVRHPQPKCADYHDEEALRAYEIAVRLHRAHSEPWEITPLDGRIDGAYQVRGESRSSYVVDIVDRSGARDACTCPDFLSNGLGTCKHVLAVRRALGADRSLEKGYLALGELPARPVLGVHANGGLWLDAIGAWPKRLLATHSLPSAGPFDPLPLAAREFRPGATPTGVRVLHAVVPVLERARALRAVADRQQSLSTALTQGRVGLDVLSQPLFPFQRDGVAHLVVSGRALLADDMGLGKTVQTIAACEVLRRRGEAARVIVVTPSSLKDQWAREIARYAGEAAVVVGGAPALRREAFASDAPYKILNYELTWRELEQLQALDADILVLDEAQRAKNFRTKTAITLRNIPSRFLFVLTGTPVENRLDDLYSLLQLIDPTLLGPLWRFNFEFHVQSDKGKVTGYKNLGELRRRVSPVVLRRRKEEVLLQLPPLTTQTRYTKLTDEQRDLELEHRKNAAVLMKIAERRPLSPNEQKRLMMSLLKARQACDALELCDPSSPKKASPKLDEFETVVSEVVQQGASKVLVFSEWVEMLKLAAERLDALGVGYAMLYGGVPTERRPALLERFREDPAQRVLLSSDAGGVGLNLQVASYVIHLDLPWNPGRLDQRTARAHRLGQTRGVSVLYLCAEEGIERGIEGTLAGKRAIREAALDPNSEVEELDAPSFAVFLARQREALERLAVPGEELRVVDDAAPSQAADGAATDRAPELAAAETPDDAVPAALCALPEHAETSAAPEVEAAVTTAEAAVPSPTVNAVAEPGAQPPVMGPPHRARLQERARNRLRLADCVLSEGFLGDAVRASHDALAATIGALLDGDPPASHEALVAAIYRELLPSGRLPIAAHGSLARLRDLVGLEAHGVDLDAALANEAVAEAKQWVLRLGPGAAGS